MLLQSNKREPDDFTIEQAIVGLDWCHDASYVSASDMVLNGYGKGDSAKTVMFAKIPPISL